MTRETVQGSTAVEDTQTQRTVPEHSEECRSTAKSATVQREYRAGDGTYTTDVLPSLRNITLYGAGYGLTLTGLRANGCGSVMLRAHVRSIVRTGVAEGMVNCVVVVGCRVAGDKNSSNKGCGCLFVWVSETGLSTVCMAEYRSWFLLVMMRSV